MSYIQETSAVAFNKHELPYIEIAGIKWARMNIGATAVTDYGLYFQWGDISGYTADQVGSGTGQKYFGWADYKYGNGTSTGMTKYNGTDGKTVLDLSDDAVNAAWGGNWRMPTTDEFAALVNQVNTAWTADYQGTGIAGMVCTDKTDSSKVLFFPAAGRCNNGTVYDVGKKRAGHYWSSSRTLQIAQWTYTLYFSDAGVEQGSDTRCNGFPLRGVLDE